MIFCKKRKSSLNICSVDCKKIKRSFNSSRKRKQLPVYNLNYNDDEDSSVERCTKAAKYVDTNSQSFKSIFHLKFSTNFPLNQEKFFSSQWVAHLCDTGNEKNSKVNIRFALKIILYFMFSIEL